MSPNLVTDKMPKYFSAKNIKKSSSHAKILIIATQTFMLWERFSLAFYPKVFPLFKNGQKKCPKTKTQNTFGKKQWISIPD
jgi:hypothetical protein